MARTPLDRSISLDIDPGGHGSQVVHPGLPSIQRLAKAMLHSRAIRDAVAGFVVRTGPKRGYSRHVQQGLRSRVLSLSQEPEDIRKEAVNALDDLARLYDDLLQDPAIVQGADELNGRFTGSITEAVVRKLLERSSRSPSEIKREVRFHADSTNLPGRRIDFLCYRRACKYAELFECKNSPKSLLDPYYKRHLVGGTYDWEDSQLFVMLEVGKLLRDASWSTHVACVTLRRRRAVTNSLDSSASLPDELRLYCCEELGQSFPPPFPA